MTAWDDIQNLAASVDMEVIWEPVVVQHPDRVCRPMEDDPWGDSGAQVCAVHQEQWWPCEEFKAGRGITPQPATVEQRLVVRPPARSE